MEFGRHDIAKIMKGKGAFVRHNGLNFSLLVPAPEGPPNEVFMGAIGIIPEPEQTTVYRQPISALAVKVLLAIRVPDGKGLARGEIAALPGGDSQEASLGISGIPSHAKTLH
jgi:hypothetical protein